MSDYEEVKSHVMEDGTEYRAVLKRDEDAGEPYDDGQWPILKLQRNHWSVPFAQAFNAAAQPYVDKFNRALTNWYNTELPVDADDLWERYLRIFHGVQHVRTYGPNQGTDYTYIAFDPAEWRERVPGPDVDLSQEKPLEEIEAWLEGDVYGVVLEKRWNPDGEYDDNDDDGWDEVESVWGFYGRRHAKEQARADLDYIVSSHKFVHRYHEHEKLSKHETEVHAILEFLEEFEGVVKLRPDGVAVTVGPVNYQCIVYEHFGVDYSKIIEERELMLRRLQEEAAADTNT